MSPQEFFETVQAALAQLARSDVRGSEALLQESAVYVTTHSDGGIQQRPITEIKVVGNHSAHGAPVGLEIRIDETKNVDETLRYDEGRYDEGRWK